MTGAELKAMRVTRGLSQRQLSEILGVARNTIWRAERFGPSQNTVLRTEKAVREKKL